jgi:hypothetical protein
LKVLIAAVTCSAVFLIGYLLGKASSRKGFAHTYVSVLNEAMPIFRAPYHD